MKKVLFASTALVAFAGAAAADITLSGNAEMGIIDSNAPNTDVGFHTDIDVTFTMSGETDNGLTFGATVDLDENGAFGNTTQGGETIFLSGNFGTITMGDTDGALDWALTEVAFNNGSINDDETEHAAYMGAYLDGSHDGQILRYDYSFGDFAFAISAELNDAAAAVKADDNYAIGFRYGLDLGGSTVNFGLGYQSTGVSAAALLPGGWGAVNGATSMFSGAAANDEIDATGLSISTTLASGLSLGITYTAFDHTTAAGADAGRDGDHMSVGVGYTTGAWSVSANYGEFDSDTNALDRDGYGLSVGYDLGGGAIVQLGYGSGSIGAAPSVDTYSLGVRMNF